MGDHVASNSFDAMQEEIRQSIAESTKHTVDRLVHTHSNAFLSKDSVTTVAAFLKTPPTQAVRYPDALLRRECKPVEEVNDDIRKVCRIMVDLMDKFRGCGLAAPQVGLDLRIFVANPAASVFARNDPSKSQVFINPEIFHYGARTSSEIEGCLSLPGISTVIDRPRKIMITWLDEDGKKNKAAYEGLMGRICQHEYDHINGKLITDRMSAVEFIRIKSTLERLEQIARIYQNRESLKHQTG